MTIDARFIGCRRHSLPLYGFRPKLAGYEFRVISSVPDGSCVAIRLCSLRLQVCDLGKGPASALSYDGSAGSLGSGLIDRVCGLSSMNGKDVTARRAKSGA